MIQLYTFVQKFYFPRGCGHPYRGYLKNVIIDRQLVDI